MKAKIAITVDAELLNRVDGIAEARGETRSGVVERMLRNSIEGEEKFLKLMENPGTRAIFKLVTSSPKFVERISALIGESLTETQAKEIQEVIGEQAAKGRERRTRRKWGQSESEKGQ